MTSRLKLALVILWAGTAAGMAIGYFGDTQPIHLVMFIDWGVTAIVVTLFILAESKKK